MTVTRIYYPEIFPVDPSGNYRFLFENVGGNSIEVWQVNATGVRTYTNPQNFTLRLGNTLEQYSYDGGLITLTAIQLFADTINLSIERNTTISQLVDWVRFDKFPEEIVEYALDKATLIAQEISATTCNIDGATFPTDITQLLSWSSYDRFPAEQLNLALDKLILILLEINAGKIGKDQLPLYPSP